MTVQVPFGNAMITRVEPAMAPGAYQTYGYKRGRDTVIVAACRDVGCEQYRNGWDSVIDETTDLGRTQAAYIRQRSGRSFKELRTAAGLTVFRFEPGQRCFTDHQTIPEKFYVRGGDWRQNQGLIRQHANGAEWAEDFGEHQQALADEIEKG